LGGSADENASLGDITGRAFTEDTIVDAIETLVTSYIDMRQDDERFIDTYRRVGMQPFKERLYAE
jgi:sulfite reductase (NADPH) hemoprotein beta-component